MYIYFCHFIHSLAVKKTGRKLFSAGAHGSITPLRGICNVSHYISFFFFFFITRSLSRNELRRREAARGQTLGMGRSKIFFSSRYVIKIRYSTIIFTVITRRAVKNGTFWGTRFRRSSGGASRKINLDSNHERCKRFAEWKSAVPRRRGVFFP